MIDDEELLRAAYAAYNTQELDSLLALVTDHVDWPDGSTRLHGKRAVQAYWLDQWTRTRTHDEPVGFTSLPGGRVVVRIQQVVRALDGSVISRGNYTHVHRIKNSLIDRMDIEGDSTGSADPDDLADAAYSRPSTATVVTSATRSTPPEKPCTPVPNYSPTSTETDSTPTTWAIYQRMIAAYREPDGQ